MRFFFCILSRLWLCIFFACCCTGPAFSDGAFLKMEGISGESTVQKHENEIDVLNWDWEVMFIPDSFSFGPVYEDFKITKNIDAATPKIMQACAKGQIFTTATLSLRKPNQAD